MGCRIRFLSSLFLAACFATLITTQSSDAAPLVRRLITGATLTIPNELNGNYYSYANSLNDSGRIVGGFYASIFFSGPRAFTALNAPYNANLSPVGIDSVVNDINNAGILVGQIGNYQAAYWVNQSDPQMLPTDTFSSNALAINSLGRIAGFDDSSFVVWNKDAQGVYQKQALCSGAQNTYAAGINDSGIAVGQCLQRAVKYSNGTLSYLSTPADSISYATDINSLNQVTGVISSYTPDGQQYQAALWSGTGALQILQPELGNLHCSASGINGGRFVVGTCYPQAYVYDSMYNRYYNLTHLIHLGQNPAAEFPKITDAWAINEANQVAVTVQLYPNHTGIAGRLDLQMYYADLARIR